MSNEMYTHKQYIAIKIFVPGQILFKLQGFEIGEMEMEHPVRSGKVKERSNLY